MKQKATKKLRVLYVTTAGAEKIEVVPNGENVTPVKGKSFKVGRSALAPKGAGFDAICIDGRSDALSFDNDSPIGPEEYDAALHNNLLQQIHQLSKGGNRAEKASWLNVGLQVVIIIGLIISTVMITGGVDDIRDLLFQFGIGGGGADQTTVRTGA